MSDKKHDEWFRLGLLRICEQLHMNCNGSSDIMNDDQMSQALSYLECRLSQWKPSILKKDIKYDNCVKALIKTTINQTQEYFAVINSSGLLGKVL